MVVKGGRRYSWKNISALEIDSFTHVLVEGRNFSNYINKKCTPALELKHGK